MFKAECIGLGSIKEAGTESTLLSSLSGTDDVDQCLAFALNNSEQKCKEKKNEKQHENPRKPGHSPQVRKSRPPAVGAKARTA